ncbi:AAA family ATPase [Nocardia sp. CY41]|uniref:AAA family ATPase n=1 Tax=Nocardia sp. CY41 TaxID=2608686 RepID=UPI00135CC312|nr:GntR family transcriptional regulator [Nocardia sp. CY41]
MTESTSSEGRRWQIARELRTEIESGRLRPGEKLPSSRALAERWGVSIGTVNLAMDQLGHEGLIHTRPRSGRVVADRAAAAGDRPRPPQPRVVYVGGYAGSGKTEVGRVLARETRWAILDKEVLTRSVVDAALVQLGSTIADRESALYREVIEPAEYQCLAAAVSENIAYGVSVIAIAPFLEQFANRAWFERQAASLAEQGADMSVIWVASSTEVMRTHLERRAAAKDTWKLGHWDQYLAGVDAQFAPAWPHTVIGNNLDDEPIQAQVKTFLRRLEPLPAAHRPQ